MGVVEQDEDFSVLEADEITKRVATQLFYMSRNFETTNELLTKVFSEFEQITQTIK